eukprot:TRINITY_DN33600_c0_g1_i1.p1 TRINITY_DN33600_c0_g1~~TRINITY_DN33600_c0_g1_i1.p1  ORF type:complete len:212 (+),score=55.22 TRINITY_DN33600_c0_g1_i1:55-690(+)
MGDEAAPFAWGGTASTLLRDTKRAQHAGDRLPPFAADDVREVRRELRTQAERAEDMQNNPHIDLSAGGEFYPSYALLCSSALRNKRCLHAYCRTRQDALTDAFWQTGQVLPEHTMGCLAPAEATFFRGYSSLCSAYMESQGLNLRSNLFSPPQITDMAFVRGKKDFHYMCPTTGNELMVTRGKFFVVTQEEATSLMQQGSVESVIEGCHET